LSRLEALERRMALVELAISKLVSIDQVTQLGLLRQTELEQLDTRSTALEQRVEALEQYHQT
jgi:hypothetical protein